MQTLMVSIKWCEEVERTIFHPAEYVNKKVHSGISCLVAPHCCTPAWLTDPICYVIKKKKIKDAWNEVVTELLSISHDLSPSEALIKCIEHHINPIAGLTLASDVGPIAAELGLWINAAYEAAQPIPGDFKEKLGELARNECYGFNTDNVDEARWLPSDHPLASRLWFPNYGFSRVLAETFYNLIIIDSGWNAWSHCQALSLWAHELVHINQYSKLGLSLFLQSYILDYLIFRDHDTMEFEKLPLEIQARVEAECLAGSPQSFATAEPPLFKRNKQVVDAVQSEIEKLNSTGEVLLADDGEICFLSPEAEEKLRLATALIVKS
jgi:hypothetical protein